MATVGYARVSSRGQTLEVQEEKLKHCDKLFKEKASGVDAQRPEFQKCLDYIREGDTLVVTKLDRLARSVSHFVKITEQLEAKKIKLVVLDQNLDTSNSNGRLMVNMLAAFAQFETEIRAERQIDGIKKAKERGTRFGCKHTEAYRSRAPGAH